MQATGTVAPHVAREVLMAAHRAPLILPYINSSTPQRAAHPSSIAKRAHSSPERIVIVSLVSQNKPAKLAAMAQSRTAVAALFLVAVVLAAASVPAVSAYGCYDDCYQRCANGKQDPACTTMCNEACGVGGAAAGGLGAALGAATTGAGAAAKGAGAAAGAGSGVYGAGAGLAGAGAGLAGAGAGAATKGAGDAAGAASGVYGAGAGLAGAGAGLAAGLAGAGAGVAGAGAGVAGAGAGVYGAGAGAAPAVHKA
ncbi:hypothetical protein GUJ93_ZPchr0006g44002 [Zizania palustris]|uniref:Uncharacterized protein n=1 Tax=Zizania palustris TaxID=103762 RepID=A0A8J5TGI4_ZIZPA|nr:hypothetical protein GUJ93_ZPchr0006g44002 [Zizania palustris]